MLEEFRLFGFGIGDDVFDVLQGDGEGEYVVHADELVVLDGFVDAAERFDILTDLLVESAHKWPPMDRTSLFYTARRTDVPQGTGKATPKGGCFFPCIYL